MHSRALATALILAVGAACSPSSSSPTQSGSARFSISPNAAATCVGDTLVMSASLGSTLVPDTNVTWNSSNPAVDSVDYFGVVHVVGSGTAIISADLKADHSKSASASFSSAPAAGTAPTIRSITISGTSTAADVNNIRGSVDIRVPAPLAASCLSLAFGSAELVVHRDSTDTVVATTSSGNTPFTGGSVVVLTLNSTSVPDGSYALYVRFIPTNGRTGLITSSSVNVTINN
jgi:hypothetical protein